MNQFSNQNWFTWNPNQNDKKTTIQSSWQISTKIRWRCVIHVDLHKIGYFLRHIRIFDVLFLLFKVCLISLKKNFRSSKYIMNTTTIQIFMRKSKMYGRHHSFVTAFHDFYIFYIFFLYSSWIFPLRIAFFYYMVLRFYFQLIPLFDNHYIDNDYYLKNIFNFYEIFGKLKTYQKYNI